MIYYIHAKSSDEIFELGAIYGLLHAWNLSKLTADSEYWRKGDITREQELELLEMPMEERIKFDSIKVSNLDVATTLELVPVVCIVLIFPALFIGSPYWSYALNVYSILVAPVESFTLVL